jgi:hypothetical protein
MKVEIGDIASRAKSFSDEMQRQLESLTPQLADEGRRRIREAVGAPSESAIWQSFGAGLILGAILGAALAVILSRQNVALDEMGDRVKGVVRRQAAGDGQPVGTGSARTETPYGVES